jgi:hypothetical protein
MKHTISFKTVAEMILWLVDNEIDQLPVDLTLHLGKTPIDKKVFHIVK